MIFCTAAGPVCAAKALSKVGRRNTDYSWYYRGQVGKVTRDVADLELTGAECKRTSGWYWYCDDLRDKDGYALPCNQENLNKVVRYIRK